MSSNTNNNTPGGHRGGKRPNNGFSRGGGGGGRAGKRGRNDDHSSMVDANGFQTSAVPAQLTPKQGSSSATHLSDVTFDSLKGKIDSRILEAIAFPKLTTVQAATIEPALQGHDVLAQAKTGTGKTVAFLLPAIQRVLNSPQGLSKGRVSILVISPTRELAMQIAKEAQVLVSRFKSGFGVQYCVGGTNKNSEANRLKSDRCDILVATPGRLVDHIETSALAPLLKSVQTWVLDEADRMHDMGFAKELDAIKAVLPASRQSLFYSATWPASVLKIADAKPDHKFINTVPPEEENTHRHVKQEFEVAPLEDILPLTLKHIALEHQRSPQSAKVIVFCPTANATAVSAAALQGIRGLDIGQVWEIHSRKSQSQRTKAMEQFRQAKTGVLFASDVAARGVDIPGVSMVIQSGRPDSVDQYIHRLGRTARAGASGRGVLILGDYESSFINLPDVKSLSLSAAASSQPETTAQYRDLITVSMLDVVTSEEKSKAYSAFLGHTKSNLKKLTNVKTNEGIVALANQYATNVLFYSDKDGNVIPGLSPKIVGKMGLRGVQGIRIVKDDQQQGGQSQRRPQQQRGQNGHGRGRGPRQA
ncbi:unnamed protein product [Sympodiomycopsis kandeliae]